MVSDLCQGRRNPGLAIAHAIERITNARDWKNDRGAKLGPIRTEEWLTELAADHDTNERKSDGVVAAE
jgi:hypothetical protein